MLRQLRVLVRELRELRPARPARQRVGERVVAAVREGFDGSGGMPG